VEEKIVRIVNEMAEVLNASQLRKLQEVLLKELCRENRLEKATTNEEYLQMCCIRQASGSENWCG